MPRNSRNDTKGGHKKGDLNGDDGNNFIFGRRGDDRIDAGGGDDSVSGGRGNDTMDGGSGYDIVTGGAGDDTFIIAADTDYLVITDFETGADMLDVTALGLTGSFADRAYIGSMTMLDGDTVLSYANVSTGETVATVTLEGVDSADLAQGDFLF